MNIYADTASLKSIENLKRYPFVAGVTTNPKIIAETLGQNRIMEERFLDHIEKISKLTDGEVFVQTNHQDLDMMIWESKKIINILGDRGIIKIPATLTGMQAMKNLSAEGIRTAATAVFNGVQAYTCMASGAEFVIPYYSRIMKSMNDGLDVIDDIMGLIENGEFDCRLLVASLKTPFDVLEVLRAGVHAVTIPMELLAEILINSGTHDAVNEFNLALEVIKEKK